ncbi:hypothetical protein M441DRAFT_302576 [Trichoderma asperellum CBS 433.97]|uniref:Uncharacterized protein n=1 Tax=Trichoderma asperellum (strain ATCC 204424 / CBS 433.97 / NBRC 101777) TaxID=1042311 RepID=A0A2T3ZJH0_TRIA4|nr:hypothetical protein M441DRAFT_302576 [Trichoderma asperellum CBS 433.97]PTB44950.1 hypothetical protein M441DRAFT_302576 [Trichoderma asperellum CBS 433.97]
MYHRFPLLAAQSESLLCFSITVPTQQECVHDSKPHQQQALTAELCPTGLHILPAINRSQAYALSRAIPWLLPPCPGSWILCAYFGAMQRANYWGLIPWADVAHTM